MSTSESESSDIDVGAYIEDSDAEETADPLGQENLRLQYLFENSEDEDFEFDGFQV